MQQSTALDILKTGANVFLTGSAGSGKSYTISQFIQYLKDHKIRESAVAITATTGIAATHIGGKTIHSFSMMGIKDEMTNEAILNLMKKREKNVDEIKKAKILIIEEISMLHRKQFELASRIISCVRGSSLPFGGLQVIALGDFYQLPPVSQIKEDGKTETNRDRFCFMSNLWADLKFKVCYLSQQYRATDNTLNNVLNKIRNDQVDDDVCQLLSDRKGLEHAKDIMHLYTHNADVDFINFTKLSEVEGDTFRFPASLEGNENALKTLKNSIMAPENLELKIGARVMFVRNNPDAGFANGTQGVVVNVVKNDELDPPIQPIVKITSGELINVEPETWNLENDSGKAIASFKQLPLRLAWAITIHKSQGMTLDEAKMNLSRTFEPGMGYVALSRLRSMDGLFIEDISNRAFELNPLAIKANARFLELSLEAETEVLNMPKKKLDKLIEDRKKQLIR